MTAADRLVHYVSRTATGEYGHGAKAIERSGKKTVAGRTNVAGGQSINLSYLFSLIYDSATINTHYDMCYQFSHKDS